MMVDCCSTGCQPLLFSHDVVLHCICVATADYVGFRVALEENSADYTLMADHVNW